MTVAIQIFISGKLIRPRQEVAAARAQAFGIWYANAREIMRGRAALAQPEQAAAKDPRILKSPPGVFYMRQREATRDPKRSRVSKAAV